VEASATTSVLQRCAAMGAATAVASPCCTALVGPEASVTLPRCIPLLLVAMMGAAAASGAAVALHNFCAALATVRTAATVPLLRCSSLFAADIGQLRSAMRLNAATLLFSCVALLVAALLVAALGIATAVDALALLHWTALVAAATATLSAGALLLSAMP
jgi:hypothetical protein